MMTGDRPSFWASLVSGGIAGLTVDVSLYPLDTLKTRLQSPRGFLKSGGFRGIYAGLNVAAAGSAPGAALFFSSYEMSKQKLSSYSSLSTTLSHMLSASFAEMVACLVRVPTEVIKQRMQAGLYSSSMVVLREVLAEGGLVRQRGLYTGYGITLLREIPFALIQFPLYEYMKHNIGVHRGSEAKVAPYESAGCGSLSGAIAAALTTPLDVIKTRLMLGSDAHGHKYRGLLDVYNRVYNEGEHLQARSSPSRLGPWRVFFSGVGPRVTWIGIGGFFFFGAYELALSILCKLE